MQPSFLPLSTHYGFSPLASYYNIIDDKLGYGNWDELKAAFRTSPLFLFDWFVKSRATQELARRCDTLIRLIQRESEKQNKIGNEMDKIGNGRDKSSTEKKNGMDKGRTVKKRRRSRRTEKKRRRSRRMEKKRRRSRRSPSAHSRISADSQIE
nr:ISWI chromatin-remodeling complex ATPase CHR11-like [Ipomoea batatas]